MGKTAKITIVDDDEAVREALGDLLSALGYAVQTYESARAFIEDESATRTACLITDVQMPEMTGLELMEHLAKNGRSVPTIVVSAHTQEALQTRALRQGAIAYLSKPLRQHELLDSLGRAIG